MSKIFRHFENEEFRAEAVDWVRRNREALAAHEWKNCGPNIFKVTEETGYKPPAYCPVTTLYDGSEAGSMASTKWQNQAAAHFGVSPECLVMVAMASDGVPGHDPEVRSRLLEACGLPELLCG